MKILWKFQGSTKNPIIYPTKFKRQQVQSLHGVLSIPPKITSHESSHGYFCYSLLNYCHHNTTNQSTYMIYPHQENNIASYALCITVMNTVVKPTSTCSFKQSEFSRSLKQQTMNDQNSKETLKPIKYFFSEETIKSKSQHAGLSTAWYPII